MQNRTLVRGGRHVATLTLILLTLVTGCAKKQPPLARPAPPPPPGTSPSATRPPAPPEPVTESPIVPPEPMAEDAMTGRSLDELNKDSPFQPVFFGDNSSEVEGDAQTALNTNADLLKKYAGWVVTIEGHCDERGTVEYNLALGERRALAARAYLVSLGISADRLRTVSYGKEFPFDPANTEEAWARNRRAHFVITAK